MGERARAIAFTIAGATAYEALSNTGGARPVVTESRDTHCEVRYRHRMIDNDNGELVVVQVREDPQPGLDHTTACDSARTVLAEIVANLPKQ